MTNIDATGGLRYGGNVPGGTDRIKEDSFKIAKEVNTILTDDKKPKEKRMEEACSKLMDLWLEDPTDKKLNTIKAYLAEKLPEDTWNDFNSSYLQPSIKVMSKISGGSTVAEKCDYEVQASSAEKLQQLGVKFVPSEKDILMSFKPGTKVKLDGQDYADDTQRLVFKLDENTKGVKLVETEKGFEIQIINKSGPENILEITIPKTDRPVDDSPKGGYTPGTRYAVINKDEVKYQKR